MDKFVKLRKIGEGSFGKAFLVKSKKDGEQYVVKEIGIIKMNAREREESRKEVAVLAQLNHPNIVTYRESFEGHGSLFIVMDYCSGGDLYSRISAQRGVLFTEDKVLDWFVQISLALKHIHDRKILHRDIKSQNIFLTSTGKVRLGDFGIAKVLNSTVELARTCIGTPYYLSPEICENKPYNNKSDVWSLGCVLYELATLKHAFESGNMKNLVLKIIRGSYPPVHCKYSYEMRNLIAQLFKRSPRDRPSINSILKKPFLRPRIQKFLSDSEYSEEFSHTVMHGMKIERKLVPPPGMGGRPPAMARPSSAGKMRPPSAAANKPRYDPSSVYGKPVIRKSRESDLKRRPGSAENRRPLPVGPSASLEKRRQDLIAKEKKRQEEVRKKQYERKHQELIEKQKMARMNKAREDGWKHLVMGSGDSDKSSENGKPGGVEAQRPKLNWPPQKNSEDSSDERGRYDHYNAYLDQLQQDREQRAAHMANLQQMDYMNADPPPAVTPSPRAVPVWDRNITPQPLNPAQLAVKQAEENRVKAGQAAERAKLVEDFLQRKKEAAGNKARGNADLYGRPQRSNQSKDPVSASRARPAGPSAVAARNREEQEYLQNLRKIRLQNFNERRKLQADLGKQRVDHAVSQEERKNKIKALREQADQRAHQLKVNLEREAFERKMKLMENQRKNAAPEPSDPMRYARPAVAPPMTHVLQQIGIVPPASSTPPVEETGDSQKDRQAEAIRKNLQENPADSEGKRWASPVVVVPSVPDSARSQWADEHQTLSGLPLEQTTSPSPSQTPEPADESEPVSARRQWGGQAGTVLHALQEVKISSATVTLPDAEDTGGRPEVVTTQGSGRLFDRVQLFEEEGEMIDRETKVATPISKTVTIQATESKSKEGSKKLGLINGLSTGSFDVPNAQILRTCSEPDLAKLFKTMKQESKFGLGAGAKPSHSVEMAGGDSDNSEEEVVTGQGEVIQEDDQKAEEKKKTADKAEESTAEDDNGEGGVEDIEDVEEDEDEDYRTVRESMASLLTLANDDDDDVKVAFSLTDDSDTIRSPGNAASDMADRGDTDDIHSENVEVSGADDKPTANCDRTNGAEDSTEEAVVEEEGIKKDAETIEDVDDCECDEHVDVSQCDEGVDVSHPDVSSEGEYLDAVEKHTRGLPHSFSELFESDESSDSDEDEDDDYDVFSNLEESRMELEQDLGFDKFMQAYKAVQAVHEDEDEDMEAGTKIALGILGSGHQHLYPKIFQLVMADTAFTEDNA